MRTALTTVTAVLLVALAVPASAQASRSATPNEAAAVSAARGQPAECSIVTVSTRDPVWATWRADADRCEPGGDGVAVLVFDDSGWQTVTTVPDDPGGRPYCSDDPVELAEIPAPIQRDLGLCDPTLPDVVVPTFDRPELHFAARPRKLGIGSRGVMLRIRWSRWTRTEGVGRAMFDYRDAVEPFRARVRLRFYRRVTCDDGRRIFTRLKVTGATRRDQRRVAFLRVVRRWTSCENL